MNALKRRAGGTGTPLQTIVISVYSDFYLSDFQPRPTLKNCFFPITHITKKLFTWATGKTFFYLTLNITFYFKCCLHNNCSVNLNWNNTQLYSSAKPLHNVPSSVFWFVNFCFLPFLCRTSIQKWKKIWFCYAHKWIGKKEMLAKICQKLMQRCVKNCYRSCCTNQSCLQRSQDARNFEKLHCFVFKFLDLQHKISIALWLLYLPKHFLFIYQ